MLQYASIIVTYTHRGLFAADVMEYIERVMHHTIKSNELAFLAPIVLTSTAWRSYASIDSSKVTEPTQALLKTPETLRELFSGVFSPMTDVAINRLTSTQSM